MEHRIWVVGSPRSGTSFLTDFIGQYTDHCFNEPWNRYPLGKHKEWDLPAGSTVFKYCANAFYHEEIQERFPESKWVNIVRNPFYVLYSMCFPKADSRPHRSWSEFGPEINKRVREAFCKWFTISNASRVINGIHTVSYEEFDAISLGKFLDLPISEHDLARKFSSRNHVDPDKFQLLIDALKRNGLYETVEERGKLVKMFI